MPPVGKGKAGIAISIKIIMAKLFRRFLVTGPSTPFVMELPPYRLPMAKSVIIHMWERGWLYLKKAGTVILSIAIIMWFLVALPRNFPGRAGMEKNLDAARANLEQQMKRGHVKEGSGKYKELYAPVAAIENEIAGKHIENSIAGRIGHAIEPVFKPLGFDWKADISLIAAFAAKEIVVSTLGTIYSVGATDETSKGLRDQLRKDPVFNPLVAYVLMLFTLLTVPCMAAVAVIKRETNSWKWPLFSIAYQSALAWSICFVVYQIGRAAGIGLG